jgi:hypothetical protein
VPYRKVKKALKIIEEYTYRRHEIFFISEKLGFAMNRFKPKHKLFNFNGKYLP